MLDYCDGAGGAGAGGAGVGAPLKAKGVKSYCMCQMGAGPH